MSNPITINTEEAIAKLIAFIKAKAKARFNIDPELMDEILLILWRLAKESGITIHYVDEIYDHGNIIFQATCEIDKNDTPDSLAQKIHTLEHKHYPAVIASLLSSHK